MPSKKNKKSPLEKEYEKELENLNRRIKSWEKKYKLLYNDIPKTPKKITAKSINKIKDIKYSNLSEKQKKKYREAYDYAYENENVQSSQPPSVPYSPPTEDDYINNVQSSAENSWDETPNEPVKSQAEIDAFIEDVIGSILNTSGITNPSYAVQDILSSLLQQLRFELGERGFYEYLSDTDTVTQLTEAAFTAMATSPPKNGGIKQQALDAIQKFTFILNNHRPLTIKQSEDLEEVIETQGNIIDFSFDFED